MNLQDVAVRFAHQRKKIRIVQPRWQHRDYKPDRMNNWAQDRQPRPIGAEVLLRAIEVELELLDFYTVRGSVIEKLFRNIDNHARRRIIYAKWSGKRRNSKRDRAVLSLPLHRFPIDERFGDLRVFAAEVDLCAKENNTVQSSFGFPK